MSVVKNIKQMYLSSHGRIARQSYFVHLSLLLLSEFVCCYLFSILFFESVESLVHWIFGEGIVLAVILIIFTNILFLNLTAKRWHDMNHSGWTSIVLFTPLSGLAFLALIFLSGDSGDNKFGTNPV